MKEEYYVPEFLTEILQHACREGLVIAGAKGFDMEVYREWVCWGCKLYDNDRCGEYAKAYAEKDIDGAMEKL